MSESAQATTLPARPAGTAVVALLRRWWFPGGVLLASAAAAAFLAHQLMAWPPHEDETLALFIGRDSLPGVVEHVTRDRGGAPLHFLVAWAVAHLGLGLGGLRGASALFAIASLPLVALLGRRLVDARTGLIAAALCASSWGFLFHGVYGRMYSLFLFLAAAGTLALLHALDGGRRRRWALWAGSIILAVAAHPYGVLLFGGHCLFIALAHRRRIREAVVPVLAVLVLGIPFWITDLVLAGRFDVGVGPGGSRLGSPWSVVTYLWRTAGDFSSGWTAVLPPTLLLAALGFRAARSETRRLVLATIAVPTAAFLLARLGGSASPESRHLIFALPLFSLLVAAGISSRAPRVPALAAIVLVALIGSNVAWAWDRTPPLFEWEPDKRQATRTEAEAWLAASSRPTDILFGYEPLYLGAWERDRSFPRTVLPRADYVLALRTLRRLRQPLGRGLWVFDASERNNLKPRLEIDQLLPDPAEAFETRAFGPFLVIRTLEPTGTVERYLYLAARASLVGRTLGIGDTVVNLRTIELAARVERGYGPSLRSRSSTSR